MATKTPPKTADPKKKARKKKALKKGASKKKASTKKRGRAKPEKGPQTGERRSRFGAWWVWALVVCVLTILLGMGFGVRGARATQVAPTVLNGEYVLYDEISPRLRDPEVGRIVTLRQRGSKVGEVLVRVEAQGGDRGRLRGRRIEVPKDHLLVAISDSGDLQHRIVPVGDVSGEAMLALGRPLFEGPSWRTRLPRRVR